MENQVQTVSDKKRAWVSGLVAAGVVMSMSAAHAALDVTGVETEMQANEASIVTAMGYMLIVVLALWGGRKVLGLFGR